MQCLVVQLIRTRKRQISGILKLLYKCHGTWIFSPKFHCIISCVLMYNLHQEMADRSNAQQAINTQYGGNNVTTVQNPGAGAGQMIVTNAASGSSIPSFGSSFTGNTDYYIQGGQPVSLESSL